MNYGFIMPWSLFIVFSLIMKWTAFPLTLRQRNTLFEKLIGTWEVRNRDQNFNEIGTQVPVPKIGTLFQTVVTPNRYSLRYIYFRYIKSKGDTTIRFSLPGKFADAQEVSLAKEEQVVNKCGWQFVPLRIHNQSCCTEQPLNWRGCCRRCQIPGGEGLD